MAQSDRHKSIDAARAKGLSPYNEAERLNSKETSVVAKANVPSLTGLGAPRTSADVLANRRAFQNAIVNAIGTSPYAKKNFISLASFPGVPGSEIIPDALRTSARRIQALKSDAKRQSVPMAPRVLNVMRYQELHSLEMHYCYQICREKSHTESATMGYC